MDKKYYETISDYLDSLPSKQQLTLRKVHSILRKALPDAEEVISYQMPAFRQEGIIVWFAANKKHYAVYVYPRIKALFEEELKEYSGTKSAIHFSYDKEVPAKLIARMAKEFLRQNLTKAREKRTKE